MAFAMINGSTIVQDARPFVGVLVSGVAVLACLRAWTACRRAKDRAAVWFWGVLAMLQIWLMIDALFAVRHGVTDLGRQLARQEGWYRQRRPVQVVAILVISLLMALAGAWAWQRLKSRGWAYRSAGAGTALTFWLMATALVSLHPLDNVLDLRIGPIPIWAMGIMLGEGAVVLGAVRALRQPRVLGDPS